MPKPMAHALADLHAAQLAHIAQAAQAAAAQAAGNANAAGAKLKRPGPANGANGAPTQGAQTSPGAAHSFAQLMREQDRGPKPAAWHEKADAQMPQNGSMQTPPPQSERRALHTHNKPTPSTRNSYTLPPGQTPQPAGAPTQVNALHALKAIQKALHEQRSQARVQQAEKSKVQRQRTAAHDAFVQAVGPVQALPDPGKILHHQARDPVPTQRLLDEQAVMRESLSDEFDAGTLLETDDKLSFLRPGVGLDVARKLRLGEWAIQGQVDLHGLRTDPAREALSEFIRNSHRSGLRCVRVIHGKGLGSPGKAPVLKSRVQRWLVQKAEVMAYVQANPNQGGDGAVLVLLRPSRR